MNINDVLQILKAIPPDIQAIDHLLSENDFTKEELAVLANKAVRKCFCEYKAAVGNPWEHGFDPKLRSLHIDNLYSNSLKQVLQCLLCHGYDPNVTIDEENAFWDLKYVDTPNVGASCMRLLLENGANPNHCTPNDLESIFEFIDFCVSYDEYTHRHFSTVQCWLVLMAFGACWPDGGVPLKMLNGHDISIFKEFEKYDFSIEDLPQVPGEYGCWKMHIYDTRTNEEVAIYE